MPEPMTRTEFSVTAAGLRVREPISREFAEALAALLPGGRVVVRQGRVVPGRRGAAPRWTRWHDTPNQQNRGNQGARQACALCGTATADRTTGGTTGGTGAGRQNRARSTGRVSGGRASGGRGAPRPASSTVFAPADVAPYVFAHEWVHRSPVFVLSGNGVRVEIDLDCLPAGTALAFIGDLRAELEVFAAQWSDWARRAEMDRAGPYPIPPLVYGGPEASPGGGSVGVRDDVPEDVPGDVRGDGVRDSGDVPGDGRGGGLGRPEGGV